MGGALTSTSRRSGLAVREPARPPASAGKSADRLRGKASPEVRSTHRARLADSAVAKAASATGQLAATPATGAGGAAAGDAALGFGLGAGAAASPAELDEPAVLPRFEKRGAGVAPGLDAGETGLRVGAATAREGPAPPAWGRRQSVPSSCQVNQSDQVSPSGPSISAENQPSISTAVTTALHLRRWEGMA